MTDELLQALKAIFTATAALTANFTGGYHFRAAEENTSHALNALIVEVVTAPGGPQFYPKDEDADIRIRFSVYSESGDGVALLQMASHVYDNNRPSMTGVDCSNFQRLTDALPTGIATKSTQQSEVWGVYMDYVFHCHRAPDTITVTSVHDNGDDTVTVTFSATVTASQWATAQLEIAATQDGSYVAAAIPAAVQGFPTKLIFAGDDFHSPLGAVAWRITSAPPGVVIPQSGNVA